MKKVLTVSSMILLVCGVPSYGNSKNSGFYGGFLAQLNQVKSKFNHTHDGRPLAFRVQEQSQDRTIYKPGGALILGYQQTWGRWSLGLDVTGNFGNQSVEHRFVPELFDRPDQSVRVRVSRQYSVTPAITLGWTPFSLPLRFFGKLGVSIARLETEMTYEPNPGTKQTKSHMKASFSPTLGVSYALSKNLEVVFQGTYENYKER